jgi:hypothetical protein
MSPRKLLKMLGDAENVELYVICPRKKSGTKRMMFAIMAPDSDRVSIYYSDHRGNLENGTLCLPNEMLEDKNLISKEYIGENGFHEIATRITIGTGEDCGVQYTLDVLFCLEQAWIVPDGTHAEWRKAFHEGYLSTVSNSSAYIPQFWTLKPEFTIAYSQGSF